MEGIEPASSNKMQSCHWFISDHSHNWQQMLPFKLSCGYVIHRKFLVWNNLWCCNKTKINLGQLPQLNEKVFLFRWKYFLNNNNNNDDKNNNNNNNKAWIH